MDGPTIPNNGYRSGPRSECGPRCYRNKRPYGPGCRYAKVALIATSSCDKADEHTRDMRVAKIGCSYYARSSILSFDIKRVECSTSSCYIPHIVASTALSRILLKWDRRWYYPWNVPLQWDEYARVNVFNHLVYIEIEEVYTGSMCFGFLDYVREITRYHQTITRRAPSGYIRIPPLPFTDIVYHCTSSSCPTHPNGSVFRSTITPWHQLEYPISTHVLEIIQFNLRTLPRARNQHNT